MDRMYSVLESKEFDDEQRTISGWATTPATDRVGDVVDQYGVQVAADIPLYLYHDSTKTVGRAKLGKATARGIPFTASLPFVKEPGLLKDRVDEAWQMVKHGLITAVSIGFRALDGEVERMKNGGLKFLKTEVLELSLVPVPANSQAVLTAVKSIDHEHLASAGRAGERVAKPAAKAVALTSTAKRGHITISKR